MAPATSHQLYVAILRHGVAGQPGVRQRGSAYSCFSISVCVQHRERRFPRQGRRRIVIELHERCCDCCSTVRVHAHAGRDRRAHREVIVDERIVDFIRGARCHRVHALSIVQVERHSLRRVDAVKHFSSASLKEPSVVVCITFCASVMLSVSK